MPSNTSRRRLLCEPLEDRRLLSVGVPDFGFALSAGAAANDYGQSVATDAAGNVYVAGAFQGTVDFDPGPGTCNLTDAGLGDIFVAKYSPAGELAWARCFGGTNGDYAYGIAVANDGSIYTTGYFYDMADFDPGDSTFNLTSAGSSDVFISKLDSSGNFVWARGIGGNGNECAYDIAVAGGNIYTTGHFNGTADFDPGDGTFNLTSAGDDIFISKLDSAGDFAWAVSMGGSGYDYGNGIAVADGYVYITGSFEGTADFNPSEDTANLTSDGYSDIFVSKLDSAGSFAWARGMGGSDDDYGSGIAVAGGSVYTTGYFLGTADFDPGLGTSNLTSVGGSDIFVSKLDSAGDFAWARSMGGGDYDEGGGIAVAGDGGVYTTGLFYGTADFDPGSATFNLVSAGSSDIFISKLDSAGDFAWAFGVGGSGVDEGNGIAVAGGSVYTTGDFYDVVDFDPEAGTFELTSAGNSDFFLLSLSSNHAPTDIALSADSIVENQPSGTAVGTFSTTDPDIGDTFAYSFVAGTGSADNASFTVSGNTLNAAVSLDYETQKVYNIRVRSTDQGGLWTEEAFVVYVTDVLAEPQGIVLSTDNVSVPEGGAAQLTVKLNTQPETDVTVAIARQSGDADLAANPTVLTFTSANWNQAQAVTLTAAQDANAVNGTAHFVLSSTGLTSQTVTATEQDDDVQGLVVTPLSVSVPEGGAAQFTVKLNAQPGSDVTVAISKQTGGDVDLSTNPTSLTFTSVNWNVPQAVALGAAPDADMIDGTASFVVSSTGLTSQKTITATERDDDLQGVATWQDTVGLFAPTPSKFCLRNTNDSGYADVTFDYGPANADWMPIAGDWNTDGTGSIGLYDPATSVFYLRNTNDGGYADLAVAYGPANAGWLPVAGDWDGDGIDTIGLYNPTTSVFLLRNTNDTGYANLTFAYGPANAGWLPIAGDWNHDGIDTVGLYNPNTSVFYLRNSNDGGYANLALAYGPASAGWKPIVGDWNADGADTTGLYSPATSVFYLRNTNDNGYADVTVAYGPPNGGWTPIVGDWNGSPSPLRAADGAVAAQDTVLLSDTALQPLVSAAIARWAAAGVSVSALSNVNYMIVDLPGSYLGLAQTDTIYLDRDAAGYGCFVDPTPALDEEFSPSNLQAIDPQAVDRIDLLTVVEHELGHIAGLDDLDASLDDLMSGLLGTGIRRTASHVDVVFAS